MLRHSVAIMLVVAAGARADEILVDFSGKNPGGWHFAGIFYNSIPGVGGNPGAFLSGHCPQTNCSPMLVVSLETDPAEPASAFVGDFRARGVTSIAADLAMFGWEYDPGPHPVSLVLMNDNGTPGNGSDDVRISVEGDLAPVVGEGWRHFEFAVPSSSATMPPGWAVSFQTPMQPDAAWNRVITSVSRVYIYWQRADFFNLPPQVYDPGADNVAIRFGAPCYANCDGSTSPPVLNVADFVCFQNEFAAGDTRANCDGSTVPPVLNVSDFVCFQQRFAAGCP